MNTKSINNEPDESFQRICDGINELYDGGLTDCEAAGAAKNLIGFYKLLEEIQQDLLLQEKGKLKDAEQKPTE